MSIPLTFQTWRFRPPRPHRGGFMGLVGVGWMLIGPSLKATFGVMKSFVSLFNSCSLQIWLDKHNDLFCIVCFMLVRCQGSVKLHVFKLFGGWCAEAHFLSFGSHTLRIIFSFCSISSFVSISIWWHRLISTFLGLFPCFLFNAYWFWFRFGLRFWIHMNICSIHGIRRKTYTPTSLSFSLYIYIYIYIYIYAILIKFVLIRNVLRHFGMIDVAHYIFFVVGSGAIWTRPFRGNVGASFPRRRHCQSNRPIVSSTSKSSWRNLWRCLTVSLVFLMDGKHWSIQCICLCPFDLFLSSSHRLGWWCRMFLFEIVYFAVAVFWIHTWFVWTWRIVFNMRRTAMSRMASISATNLIRSYF